MNPRSVLAAAGALLALCCASSALAADKFMNMPQAGAGFAGTKFWIDTHAS
jgi:hypothetical protein